MEDFFLTILNMSLTGSYVILAILLARLLLKRAPKVYSYFLWIAAAFRLICPFSFGSSFSLLNLLPAAPEQLQYIPKEIEFMEKPQIQTGFHSMDQLINPALPAATPATSVNPIQIWIFLGTILWCAGTAVLLIYAAVSCIRLHRRIRNAVLLDANVYQSDAVRSPFILGFFHPRIYIPFGLDEQTRSYILAHERCHLRCKDHWIRPLAFGILSLHWFNPLVWLAFRLMTQDMEMRCDEKVLSAKTNIRKAYSTTLLSIAANRRFPMPGPLAFGESSVKSRIRNILRWKRPSLWLSAAAVILCAILIAVCAVDPKPADKPLSDITIASATAQDMRVSPSPLIYDLNETQIDELTAQLGRLDLTVDAEYGGFTPYYGVSAQLSDGTLLWINGYHQDGHMVDLLWNETHYLIQDEAFHSYLDRLCRTAPNSSKIGCRVSSGSRQCDACYYEDDFDFHYDTLPVLPIQENTISFTLRCGCERISIGEDLYEGSFVRRNTYQNLVPDQNHAVTLKLLSETASQPEYAIYYLQCDHGEYVLKAIFSAKEDLPVETALPTSLEDAVIQAILEHQSNAQSKEYLACANYVTLAHLVGCGAAPLSDDPKAEVGMETLYVMMHYAEYEVRPDGIRMEGAGCHCPIAISFVNHADGTRSLTEYWTPQDGAGYADSIREKFPKDTWEDALDTQQFILPQIQVSYQQAIEQSQLDPVPVIDALLTRYLQTEENLVYRELMYYGDHTLRYLFSQFLQGKQTDQRGLIMMNLMEDLIGGEAMPLEAENGQAYFDAWLDLAIRTREANGDAYMQEYAPKSWLLLSMLES